MSKAVRFSETKYIIMIFENCVIVVEEYFNSEFCAITIMLKSELAENNAYYHEGDAEIIICPPEEKLRIETEEREEFAYREEKLIADLQRGLTINVASSPPPSDDVEDGGIKTLNSEIALTGQLAATE